MSSLTPSSTRVTLVVLLATQTLAHHFSCQVGGLSKDYKLWCTASVDGQGVYRCHGSDTGSDVGVHKVADWGKLAPKTLEFGTPCGTGAYGVVSRTEGAVCMSSQWVVGIGGDKTVYWLRSSDDCALPATFDQPPSSVSIWYNWKG